ncbi:MAG TPA: hypothetical protein P5294_00940 [Smithellaceae bacterium]|nr:hypothetical protein [Smithellaceae bacterium]HRS89054.1 hypothetical protein [Smithellaceae bacterium]HRV25074.1 hypothetical protein [Smithellaceae bacterium]
MKQKKAKLFVSIMIFIFLALSLAFSLSSADIETENSKDNKAKTSDSLIVAQEKRQEVFLVRVLQSPMNPAPLSYRRRDCVAMLICHYETPLGRRGNPTQSLRGHSPWQSQKFPRFARDKVSVVVLPRKDIMTQSRRPVSSAIKCFLDSGFRRNDVKRSGAKLSL